MSYLSATGRNSEQRNQLNSISSVQTISEMAQLPTTFHFSNGDEYTGTFAVLKEKQKLVMQGKGVYKTSDGEIYEGVWENDSLKEDCKVTFPDKTVFSGNFDEMLIQGLGKYKFKEKVEIEGDFVNNNVIGKVYLKDPNHHLWKGKVEKNNVAVNFYPQHPFWQSVLNLPSKAVQVFYGETAEETGNTWDELY